MVYASAHPILSSKDKVASTDPHPSDSDEDIGAPLCNQVMELCDPPNAKAQAFESRIIQLCEVLIILAPDLPLLQRPTMLWTDSACCRLASA